MPNEALISSGNPVNADLPKPKLSDHDIDYLFLRLSAIYGRLWTELYRDAEFLRFAKQEWRQALQVFERETLNRALRRCRESCEVPPTLPKLYQLCRVSQLREPRPVVPIHKSERSSPETAKRFLQTLKDIVGTHPSRG